MSESQNASVDKFHAFQFEPTGSHTEASIQWDKVEKALPNFSVYDSVAAETFEGSPRLLLTQRWYPTGVVSEDTNIIHKLSPTDWLVDSPESIGGYKVITDAEFAALRLEPVYVFAGYYTTPATDK